jgi:hypothetical protein
LEALLPDVIAGYALTKASVLPGPEEAYFLELASSLGKQVDDVAWAHATTTTSELVVVIEATRVVGADGDQIRDFVIEGSNLSSPPSEDVVAGKQVLIVPSYLGSPIYLYASGDVFYRVDVIGDVAVLEEVLAALP